MVAHSKKGKFDPIQPLGRSRSIVTLDTDIALRPGPALDRVSSLRDANEAYGRPPHCLPAHLPTYSHAFALGMDPLRRKWVGLAHNSDNWESVWVREFVLLRAELFIALRQRTEFSALLLNGVYFGEVPIPAYS